MKLFTVSEGICNEKLVMAPSIQTAAKKYAEHVWGGERVEVVSWKTYTNESGQDEVLTIVRVSGVRVRLYTVPAEVIE